MSAINNSVSAIELPVIQKTDKSPIQKFIEQPIDDISRQLELQHASVRKTKFGDDIYIIKFTPDTKVNDPIINQLKGLIFNHKSGKILSMTYPVPVEMKDLPEQTQKDIIDQLDTEKYTIQPITDGTLLRMWYLDEQQKWILSTNGKEDAYYAFWMNGMSFGDQFESTGISLKFDLMNKDYVYLFVLCHPMNVIVINHDKPELSLVAVYDRTTLREIQNLDEFSQIGVNIVPKSNIQSVKQVHDQVLASKEKPVKDAGYNVICEPDKEGVIRRFRFENFNYIQARNIRGDSNNLQYFLLPFILQNNGSQLGELLEYYPVYRSDVMMLIDRLEKLTTLLYSQYGLHFKRGENIKIHHRHYPFLQAIHKELYLKTLRPAHKTVQRTDISNFIRDQPTARVLYLLNYIYDVGK